MYQRTSRRPSRSPYQPPANVPITLANPSQNNAVPISAARQSVRAFEHRRNPRTRAVADERLKAGAHRQPAETRPLPQQTEHRADRRRRARIDAHRFRNAARRLLQRQAHDQREQQTGQADDHERGAPVERVVDPAAGERADHRADRNAERINAERGGAAVLREHVGDHRVRRRTAAGFANGHTDARQQQVGVALRESAQAVAALQIDRQTTRMLRRLPLSARRAIGMPRPV